MIKPIGKNVLIKMSGLKETTKGGIIIPNAERVSDSIGKIIAVGPEADPQIVIGQHALVEMKNMTKCEDEGIEYHLINGDKILAVIEGALEDE